jgi:hypothetical protein
MASDDDVATKLALDLAEHYKLGMPKEDLYTYLLQKTNGDSGLMVQVVQIWHELTKEAVHTLKEMA